MATAEFHLNSNHALRRMTAVSVITPETGKGPWPVLYLLHGLSDDHTAWVRRTSIERHVANLGVMVVMPNGGRSFYADSAGNPQDAYDTFIAKDLPAWVEKTFRVKTTGKCRLMAGLSMGGYGAVKFALKYPGRYAGAVSFSGAVGANAPFEAPRAENAWRAEFKSIWGKDRQGSTNDLSHLARKLSIKNRIPLRIDCGSEDFLIGENRGFHAWLNTLGYAHEYEEHAGSHDWGYWDAALVRAIPFLKRCLGIR